MSRYKNLNQINIRLEFPKPLEINDITIGDYQIITVKEGQRLDTIAYDFYKDSNLWWVLAKVNNLRLPFISERLNLIVPLNVNGIISQLNNIKK